MNISKIQVKWVILLCSACAYILSLFYPALLVEYGEPWSGGGVLALGWMGILDIPNNWAGLAWWANPIYFLAIIAYIRASESSIAKRNNVIPLCLGVLALFLGAISIYARNQDFSGSISTIVGFGISFYLWMVSFLIFLIACFFPPAPNLPTQSKGDAS